MTDSDPIPANNPGFVTPTHGIVTTGVAVAQPRGGFLWQGKAPNHVAGPGRPKEELRAKIRELGAEKGLPFLAGILAGRVDVQLVGTCDACQHEQPITHEWKDRALQKLASSVDQRMKATDLSLKYGLGTMKEVSVENVRERMAKTLEVIRGHCSPEQAEAIVAELRGIWV